MLLKEIIEKARNLWECNHAKSTNHCQRIYFDKFYRLSIEWDISYPCQLLYDRFMLSATTENVRFYHFQVVKAVDLVANTFCITEEGFFINEPPFPDIETTNSLVSRLIFPVNETIDISIFMIYIGQELQKLGLSDGLCGQYWRSWKYIRAYFYQKNGNFDFNNHTLDEFFLQNDKHFKEGKIPSARYYSFRKAIVAIKEMAETGRFTWKRVLSNPVCPLSEKELETIRQEYLSYLKKNNYATDTVRLRDYVFRYAFIYADIHTKTELYSLSLETIQKILKKFSKHWHDIRTPVTIFKSILLYLYENGLIKNDYSKLPLNPLIKKGHSISYISDKDEELFYEYLYAHETKRNIAIILLARKLGLRTRDICNLTFEQIDWKNEKIRINQHKTGEPLVMPLLTDVGNALMDYILEERPRQNDEYPYIFLRSLPPYTQLKRIYAISDKFFKNSGIVCENGTSRGMHVFRKTLVNRLLIKKVPHQVITDTLGHTSKNSDKAYIPLEESMLRMCALDFSFTCTFCYSKEVSANE